MAAAMEKTIFCLLVVIFAVNCDRTVTTKAIQCSGSPECGDLAITHVQAIGSTDALHYLISPVGLPTVFVAYTTPRVNVSIDWSALLQKDLRGNSVKFDTKGGEAVHYTYAVLFTKLIEYNDTKDNADMTKYSADSTSWNVYNLEDIEWKSLMDLTDTASNTVTFKADYTEDTGLTQNNGTFSIKIRAFSSVGREDQLPHLQYSENITQFDVDIDHVWTNLSASRFALEVMVVGEGGETMSVDETQSIDDEYTPGVFSIYNWKTRPNAQDSSTGFIQWKPVCYNALERARDKATGMKHYTLVPADAAKKAMVNKTVVLGYYGDKIGSCGMWAQNFSFGLSQDGGFNKTGVTTWSGSIGYGDPPADKVSTLVIVIISAGLGLPVVIIIFGGIFVCIRKQNAKPERQLHTVQNGYQKVDDDDDDD